MATESQLASSVLMIRPARFQSNPQTAESNAFQTEPDASPAEQQRSALTEFEGVVAALRGAGIDVLVFDDTREPHTPDSVFPNNWVSFHADGTVVLYPMEAENRRCERRSDVIDRLDAEFGFQVREIVDLSHHEAEDRFLEGTGSMVLDRVNRVAYACLSSRTHLDVLGDFAQRMDYDVVAFEALDRGGVPIYHTNVLMAVGEKLAVICEAAIARDDQRAAVVERLASTGHDIVSLDFDQLESFAGNMLELRAADGVPVMAMSQRAWDSLRADQRAKIEANGRVVTAAIDDIEDSAGGSVRCMLAEIHLPRDASTA
ncbi:MAG TPA: arginine deiminase-related protein [Steroidobacteraceae bacterium]|nr:arginine deiminase-related protein [Steroidobacteraceae bacterium]